MAEPPPNPLSAAMAHELNGNAVAPLFSAAPGAAPAAAIDLDDVFADCFFGREGDADLLDDIAAAYVVVANYIEGCAVTREEFDKWVEVEGDAQTAAHKRLADLDELRADIKRQQDAAQRQAEEAKARIEGRERRHAGTRSHGLRSQA